VDFEREVPEQADQVVGHNDEAERGFGSPKVVHEFITILRQHSSGAEAFQSRLRRTQR
jgi:hypothetical protein